MTINLSASRLAIDQQAQAVAKQYGLDPNIFASLIYSESSLNPNIGANSIGYTGLGQLSPALVAANGIDPNNAAQNLDVSAKTLHAFLSQYHGNYLNALSNYKGAENNPLARAQAAHVLDIAASNAMVNGHGIVVSGSGGTYDASTSAPATGVVATVVNFLNKPLTDYLPASIKHPLDTAVKSTISPVFSWVTSRLADIALVLIGATLIIIVTTEALGDSVTIPPAIKALAIA